MIFCEVFTNYRKVYEKDIYFFEHILDKETKKLLIEKMGATKYVDAATYRRVLILQK